MNLSERITEQRRIRGWSQEELAYRLGVSRQAVSKWESSQSTPDMERIIQMSELFGVTTDWLLKGEIIESYSYEEDPKQQNIRIVTREEAMDFLNQRSLKAQKIAFATMLCIVSPAPLIILAAMAEQGIPGLSDNTAALIGLIALFGMIAYAVYLFMISGAKEEPYRFLKTEPYELEAGAAERIMERKSRYMVTYHQGISTGVVLCILSVVPLLASVLLERDVMVVGSVGLLLVIVASGVRKIICVSMIRSGFSVLLQDEGYSVSARKENQKNDMISSTYWSIVTAGYLLWSFLSHDWHITWLVFVVAGVLYEPVKMFVSSLMHVDR